MGLTKDYLRYTPTGICNIIGSVNGMVQALDNTTCATSACENVNFFNMRTLERTSRIHGAGKGAVTTFKFNHDRSVIAIGYADGDIHAYRRSREKDVIVLTGHRTGVNCLAFSPDGLVLASGGKDSVIILWDLVSEAGLFRLNGHKGSITQMQFTRNSQYLLSSSKDYQLKFWNLANHSCFYTIAENVTEVYTFALLKEDRLLVIGSGELALLVYEIRWLDRLLDDENGDGGRMAFSAFDDEEAEGEEKKPRITEPLVGGDYIEEENEQANTLIRCKKRGTLVRQAKGKALQIATSSDETVFTCIGNDTLVDVFRVFSETESKKRFRRKVRKERSRLGEEVLTAQLESEIAKDVTLLVNRVGDIRMSARAKWIDMCGPAAEREEGWREFRLYCLTKTNDVHGISLKVNSKSSETRGESVVNLERKGHRSAVTTLCIASNGASLVSGSSESAILWDADTLSPVNCFTHEQMKDVSAALFVPGDKEILLFTKSGYMFMFDLADCELLYHQQVHSAAVTCAVQLPPDRTGFVTCGLDKQARFWSYEPMRVSSHRKRTNITFSRFMELPDEVLCAAISPNGRFIALGLLDNTCRVYFLDSLKFFLSLYGHSLPVFAVDISTDCKLIATGSGDKTVKIWGLDFGDCHRSLFAHNDTVTYVKFGVPDEDEQLLWSAGKDGKIKQWDALKFHRVQTLDGHNEEVRALTATSDGKTLISASNDRSIRVWELSDEIIVLQEEEEREREKEYEAKLLEADDVVPGEPLEREADLAPIKSIDSIKSTENILEAIDVYRNELISMKEEDTAKHIPHPMLADYPPEVMDRFILDVLHRVRSSHLEKSLLMVPFSYVPDILKSLCICVKEQYRTELACRVILFLIRIHHNQVINSLELLPIIDELRSVLPGKISEMLDQTGFNLAALRFLQMQIEEKNTAKMFRNVASVDAEKAKRAQKRKRRKVKDVAIVRDLTV